ncbi:MAG: imidazolonepropionase [Leptolyngbya sp. PLA3]|nr:MAG: imidazolonepropionase [Cyanobacteria bacterium CYA]MCE7968621.1 imidazolonepropionase [Leptolyngbya sp. PL-A3]
MIDLLIRHARVVGPAPGRGAVRGRGMQQLSVVDVCDVAVDAGMIVHVGPGLPVIGRREIEAGGRVLLPGLIDCHTHMCWAGSRVDEWERRLAGATYIELLGSGGGIMSTVRAVRLAGEERLAELLLERLEAALSEGSTTVEVKSGYGLSTQSELKMLRAIDLAASKWSGTVIKTACIGHAMDPDEPRAVDRTIRETLPAVHAEFPGVAIDAYCEKSAWSLEDCIRLFDVAGELGHPCRVHADQFTSMGMVGAGVRRGFRSVDHLEASTSEDIERLGDSPTLGVVLPCSGFHVDGRYADARRIIDAGGAVALATNCNPGSAPCVSMPMAMALGVRFCGLCPAESIVAGTANAASVLGLEDRGRIEPGLRGDLVLIHATDERALVHDFGTRHADVVITGGRIVRGG